MKKTPNKQEFTLDQLALKIGAELEGNPALVITGAAPIQSAQETDLTFVANKRYAKFISSTKAGAIVLPPDQEAGSKNVLRHDKPYYAFALAIDLLYPNEQLVPTGIHETAVIEPGAKIDPNAAIGPLCHVCDGAVIGKGVQLVSDVYVGKNATLDDNSLIYPGARIMHGCKIGKNVIIHASTVIGSDGFGFAESDSGLKKIKQVGWVEIADEVEIGSNVSIDRGALGPTKIGYGTKIDNLVQIAHNVEIGAHSIIVAQVGISGSTKIGNGVVLAGQVGIVGHVEIGDGVQIGAQSGISKSVPAGKKMFGYPALEIMETMRIDAALKRLPDLLKRVKKLEDESDK